MPIENHFLLLILFALLVSIVFAVLLRDDVRSQVRLGAMLFGAFVGVALALGWVMYPLPV